MIFSISSRSLSFNFHFPPFFHLFIKVNRIRLAPKNGEVHGTIHHRTIPAIEPIPATLLFGHHFREISDRIRNHRLQGVEGRGPSDSILIHAQLEIPEGQDLPERSSTFG